jgi:hypothetical protein
LLERLETAILATVPTEIYVPTGTPVDMFPPEHIAIVFQAEHFCGISSVNC